MSKRREDIMKTLAYDLSMEYQGDGNDQILPFLQGFRLFRQGNRKKIHHLLSSEHPLLEYKSYIFDYHFTKGSGNSRVKYAQTVFFMQSKKLGLPEFWMKPETFFYKIAEFLKLKDDIDFVDYPEFSKQYQLQGEDEDYIRATMNDQILHFFTINKHWSLEGVNYYLIFYRKNYLFPPKTLKDFYKKGLHLARLLEAEDLGL